jgi:uncharacterized cupredoxin-like copper-binding protein
MKSRGLFVISILVFAFALVACGPATEHTSVAGPQQVQVAETDYTIHSSVTSFVPGTAYHFRITNNGKVAHEFMIMPKSEGAMPGMAMSDMDTMALAKVENIAPGQTASLDYTFLASTKGSHPQLVCYYPGHYEAGMKQDATVQA